MRTFGWMMAAFLVAGGGALRAADAPSISDDRANEIVQKFAAKEAEFAQARESYTYHQTARIQTLDAGGNATGKWETVSDIVFDVNGKRSEHVVRAPVSTLTEIQLTPQDLQDLADVQPFVLTTKDLPKYLIRYLGRQKIDEIGCYVFAVKPKKLEPGQRYFQGEVWVDDQDLQIVKSYGRGVGQLHRNEDQQFPKFETYREQIDGKYWFPTYTIANDTLHFKDNDVKIKQMVKYEDYKQFKASTSITFGDPVDEKDQPKDQPKEATPPKKP